MNHTPDPVQDHKPDPQAISALHAGVRRRLRRDPNNQALREQADRLASEYYAAKLEEYIRDVVEKAPVLSPEQLIRLHALLQCDVAEAS